MKRSIIAILLAVAMLTAFAACGGSPAETEPTTIATTEAPAPTPVNVTLTVTMADGTKNTHEITTEKQTLGEALDEAGLIERDEKGMIVKVDGVEASWDADQAYWALYVNEEYSMKGADDVLLANGTIYEFRYTKD